MPTTDNGYSAPPAEGIRAVGWDGAFAVPGVKDWEPVWAIFEYLMREFDTRVEWLRPGWCWGFAFRANANNPNSLSRHSGAIAVDLNAPLHPNGVPTRNVFTADQIQTINKILDEMLCPCHGSRSLRWGGDYTGTPDAMHFEINLPPSCIENVAHTLKNGSNLMMDQSDRDWIANQFREMLQPVRDDGVRQTQRVMGMLRNAAERDRALAKTLKSVAAKLEDNTEALEEAEKLDRRAIKLLKELDEMEQPPVHSEPDAG